VFDFQTRCQQLESYRRRGLNRDYRWLKINLGLDAKDWPETHDNDPEPYAAEEAAKLEAASAAEINLLIRTFRQTGCRDMELAHLNDTDLLDSKEIYIREKPCQ
jgi:hypothetical protein